MHGESRIRTMRDTLVLFALRLLAALPLPVAQALGWCVGQLVALVPNRERANAEVNVALCFPDMPPAERRRFVRHALVESACTLIESPRAWLRDPAQLLARVDPQDGEERICELLARGKGLIFAAPHLGNWEMGVHFLTRTTPTTVLYRPPRQQVLEAVMVQGRGRDVARVVPTDASGIRTLYQALGRGEAIAVLPDQQPKEEGSAAVFAPFFGQEALTMTLLSRLARKTGAAVLFVFVERLPRGRGFRMHWLPAPDGVADADARVAATALNLGVEQCVAVCPTQYQWTYRRFRKRPAGLPNPYRR
jgi:KDO2-lipid IV(A) lauroyltransferase